MVRTNMIAKLDGNHKENFGNSGGDDTSVTDFHWHFQFISFFCFHPSKKNNWQIFFYLPWKETLVIESDAVLEFNPSHCSVIIAPP